MYIMVRSKHGTMERAPNMVPENVLSGCLKLIGRAKRDLCFDLNVRYFDVCLSHGYDHTPWLIVMKFEVHVHLRKGGATYMEE